MPGNSPIQNANWASPRGLKLMAALVAALSILLLALFSAKTLLAASQLQGRLDSSFALLSAQQRLIEALKEGGTAGLQATANEILTERWGFSRLSVHRGDGRLLAEARRQSNPLDLLLQGLPGALSREQNGQLPLPGKAGAALSVDYALEPGYARLVHDEALDRLRSFGVIGLALSLPFAAGLLLLIGLAGRAPSAAREARLSELPGRLATEAARAAQSGPPLPAAAKLAALEGLPIACILCDEQLHVLELTPEASRLTGWAREEARGQLVYSVFRCTDLQMVPTTSPAERCLHAREAVAGTELLLQRRSAATAHLGVEAAAAPYSLAEGQFGVLMWFFDTSQRTAGSEALRERAQLAMSALDQLGEGVLTTDLQGIVKTANQRVQRLFGYNAEELKRMSISRLLPVPFMNTPGIKLLDYSDPGATRLPKVAGWRKDATTFQAELIVKPLETGSGSSLLVVINDITDRQRAVSQGQRLVRLLGHSSEEIYIFDTQSLYFVEVNERAQRNLNMSMDELGRLSLLGISPGLESHQLEAQLTSLRGGSTEQFTYLARHRRADGSSYPVEVRLTFSREEEPPVFMAIAQDITEREAAETRMRQLAHYDLLTGLPNRALLFDRLKQSVIAADRSQRNLAIFFLDLNGFKPINDGFGHDAGDEVLKAVAQRLSDGLRAGDTVARLGGDEFVVLAEGLAGLAEVTALAWKVIDLFEAPFEVKGTQQRLSTSLGITVYPQDRSEAEALLRHADAAMYQSKQAGPGSFHFHGGIGAEHEKASPERGRSLARDIEPALATGQFQCEFWPVFGTDNQQLVAGLGDFHWSHPQLGRISSADTLVAARRSGLNVAVEQWLLKQIARQYHHAEKLGIPLIPVIVKISARQWRDPEFPDLLLKQLRDAKCPPQGMLLCLEAADWLDAAGAVQMLWPRLLQAGIRVALREPDLGQTLESVGAILLPSHFAERVAEDVSIGERIRAYAATGLPLIAEGVNTRQQKDRLQLLGCNHHCGALATGPYTPAEFASWFGARKVRAL